MGQRMRIALSSGTASVATLAARRRYVDALERAGAQVTVVEPEGPLPSGIDGLCLSGGGDIAPARYGAPEAEGVCENVSEARDATEFELVRDALARDIPILGVCRGFQVLNVALGGTLTPHVDGHHAKGDDVIAHRVTPLAGSLLARACGDAALTVNSRHHQAVTAGTLAPGLRATAFADGLVEAFESPRHRWVVGVQWHPERTSEVDPAAARIFDAFAAEVARSPIASS